MVVSLFCLVSSAVRAELPTQEVIDAVHSLRVLSDESGHALPDVTALRTKLNAVLSHPGLTTAIDTLKQDTPKGFLEDLAVLDWRHERDGIDPKNKHTHAMTATGYERLREKIGMQHEPAPKNSLGELVRKHQRAREDEIFEKLQKVVAETKDLTARADYPDAKKAADVHATIGELTALPVALQSAIRNHQHNAPKAFLHNLNTVLLRAAGEETDRRVKVVRDLGFDRLAMGIRTGPSDPANPTGSMYDQLHEMDDVIHAILSIKKAENVDAREKLAENGGLQRHTAFTLNMAALGGAFLGAGLYVPGWMGFQTNFVRALGSWSGVWAGASIGSFGWYYPMIASPLGRLFLGRSYREFHETLTDMLKIDPDRALPYVKKLAETPSAWPYTAQQNLALEAMEAVKDPLVTDALLDLAIHAINDRNPSLARRLLQEVVERERTETTPAGTKKKNKKFDYTGRGEAALAILEAVDASEEIPAAKLWRLGGYLVKNPTARRVSLLLGATGAGVAYYFGTSPEILIPLATGILSGAGTRGLLAVMGQLFFGNTEAYLHRETRPQRETFRDKAAVMLEKMHGLTPGQQGMLRAFANRSDNTDPARAEAADNLFDQAAQCKDHLRDLRPANHPHSKTRG